MSERANTQGAEDMLASIRRLVADEVRPVEDDRPRTARLLLTQALRVETAPPPPPENRVRPLRAVLIERRAAQAPLLLSPAEAVSDGAVAPARAHPLRLVAQSAPPTEAPDPAPLAPAATVLAEAAPAVAAIDEAESIANPEFLKRLAELEQLLDARAGGFEADGLGHDPAEDFEPWLSQLAPEPFIALDLRAELSPPVAAEPSAAPAAAAVPPEATGAAPALAAAPLAEPPPTPGLPADEAVLRALIRQVLRDELEGPMGERVTRNLRKLIRTELVRAFAARGLG